MERQEAINLLKNFFLKRTGSFYTSLIQSFFKANEINFAQLRLGFPILGSVIKDYELGKIDLEETYNEMIEMAKKKIISEGE